MESVSRSERERSNFISSHPKPISMAKHIVKMCDVEGCETEASYWIDTTEGFVENLLHHEPKTTFYLCLDHQYVLMNGNGMYAHLRLDTGEIDELEIGSYACHPKCRDCNR
jgi:hypothetical protein